MIKAVSDIEGFTNLGKIWKSLAIDCPFIFQTYEWCYSAWRTYLNDGTNRLYVLVWEQEGRLDKVLFPFYVDAVGTLRFIMDEHSDYCDCVYGPGVNHHLAFKEALELVKTDKSIKRIALTKLRGDSEILNYWGMLDSASHIKCANTISWIDVPQAEDFATSQEQLRSKDKANVRAIRRKAEKRDVAILKKGGQFPVEVVKSLRDSMIAAGLRAQDFMPDSLVAFCEEIFNCGQSDIVLVKDNAGKVVALNFILLMGDRRLSWVFLYTDSHASTEMYVKYLNDECVKASFVFDFGTGGYDYKLGTFRPKLGLLFGLQLDLTRKECAKRLVREGVRLAKDSIKFCIGRK